MRGTRGNGGAISQHRKHLQQEGSSGDSPRKGTSVTGGVLQVLRQRGEQRRKLSCHELNLVEKPDSLRLAERGILHPGEWGVRVSTVGVAVGNRNQRLMPAQGQLGGRGLCWNQVASSVENDTKPRLP